MLFDRWNGPHEGGQEGYFCSMSTAYLGRAIVPDAQGWYKAIYLDQETLGVIQQPPHCRYHYPGFAKGLTIVLSQSTAIHNVRKSNLLHHYP